jgi:hypothetical protein
MNHLGISIEPFGYDPYEDTLKQFHTDTTGHSGRTLIEHLKGTRKLLEDWGMPQHVCIAGLFHSIYGTNIFTTQSASFDDRDLLKGLIGEQAEWLAYLFCVTERPNAFFSFTHELGLLVNRHTQERLLVRNLDRLELIVIEAANHIEQDMGAELIAHIWERSQHNCLMTRKAMDDMRRFMYKHGITR